MHRTKSSTQRERERVVVVASKAAKVSVVVFFLRTFRRVFSRKREREREEDLCCWCC